jgi:PAS domain S-box-containing protein
MTKAEILIVEDEAIIARDIERHLTGLGYQVVSTAASGEDAIREAGEKRPDLVLMDIRIRGDIDGVEAAEQVRARFDIPVVYLTAHADEATLERAKVTEPFGYLLKPFEKRELRSAIELALYKHQMERRLRESEERFRALIENGSDIVAVLDMDGTLRYISPSVERVLGYAPKGIIGTSIYEFVHPEEIPQVRQELTQQTKDQVDGRGFPVRLLHRDGSWRVVEAIGRNHLDDPAVAGIVVNARDITERRKAEEALRRYADQLEALEEAAAAVSRTLDLDHVLDRILEQVERVVAGDAFNIMLVEGDNARVVRWRRYKELGVDVPRSRSVPLAAYPSLVRMKQTGKPVVVPDTATDPDWAPGKNQDWLRSYVAAPIQSSGLTVGFLNVNATRPGQFGSADAHRLEAFASHAAAAIENARLHQELRAHAGRLEEQVEERTAQLKAQYARLDAILRSTTEGIVVTDSGGDIIQANPVADAWMAQTLSPEDATRLREAIRNLAVSAEEPGLEVLELKGLDLALRAAPIGLPEEEGATVVDILDVSHLKALDRMKTRFITNISHELRTPVTTIKLCAHLMRKRPDRQQEFLDLLMQEAEHLARVVQTILGISRMDAGRLEMEPCPTALKELVKTSVANKQVLAQDRGLALEHHLVEPGPVALVDPDRMAQVLDNLISNAIQYTPEGGKVAVSTGTQKAEGRIWATVTVSDTGIGIPAEELPHIFDRFFRGDEPRSRQISGTGLGLSIAKEITELHGGRVTVDSEPGVGSTFTAWLPVADGGGIVDSSGVRTEPR